jgi:hypothetical protein
MFQGFLNLFGKDLLATGVEAIGPPLEETDGPIPPDGGPVAVDLTEDLARLIRILVVPVGCSRGGQETPLIEAGNHVAAVFGDDRVSGRGEKRAVSARSDREARVIP